MKKFKMTLLTLVAMLCLVFGMAFAVACGGDEGGNEGETEYYTLTLTYEKSQGTVTASAAASDKGYVKDETVTLTVTPAENYAVDSVKIGETGLNAGTDGKYSFKIGGNTTVTVTFKDTTPAVTYYTVTLSYDESQGSVKKSDPASENGYVKGETVTLTVTPAADYEVDSVKIGDAALDADAEGKYIFAVEDNTTVTVTFKEVEKGPSENALLLDEEYYGTYHDMAEADKSPDLVINKNGVFWGENEVLLKEDIDEMGNYTVTVGDDTTPYAFRLNDDGTIFLFTFDTSVDLTFLKEGVTLSYSVTVTIVGDETWGTATLSPEKTTYEQGERVTLTVTPAAGYLVDYAMVGMDIASFDDDGKYEFTVTMDTDIFVYFKKDVVISEEFRGEWTNIKDSADKLTLGDKTLTWAGHEVTVDSIDEYQSYDEVTLEPVTIGLTLSLTIDGNDGILVTLFNGANAFNLSWFEFGDTGVIDHTYYFVKGDGGKVAAEDLAAGSFTQLNGFPHIKTVVAEDGSLTIDGQAAKVYYTGENYLVAVSSFVYLAEIVNANLFTVEEIGAEEPATLFFLRDEFTVAPYAPIVGEWTGANGEKLNIAADGAVTLTGVEGVEKITLLASDAASSAFLVQTADGYEVAEFYGDYGEGTLNYYLMSNTLYVSLSKAPETLKLGETWQSAYAYSGEDFFPPFQKFVVDENGLGFVNRFNVLIEGSYAYGAKASETEYVLIVVDEWGTADFYTLKLDAAAKTITVVDSYGDEYVYAQTTLEVTENFKVTLDFDGEQGSATVNGEMAESDGKTYYIEKEESTASYTFTLSVTANPGFAVDTVTVGGQTLTVNENGTYTFTSDGTDVTVTITFKEAALEPVVLDASRQGTYSCEGLEDLVVAADGSVKWGENVVYLVEAFDTGTGYTVMIDGGSWTLDISESDALSLMNMTGEYYYFTKNGGSTATSYTVTVTCEAAEGTYSEVMGTASADKTTCNANDTVTVTVTVESGYEIETVTANGETLTFTEAGNGTFTYTYTVTEDTAIVVTFKVATSQDAPAA